MYQIHMHVWCINHRQNVRASHDYLRILFVCKRIGLLIICKNYNTFKIEYTKTGLSKGDVRSNIPSNFRELDI